MTRLVLLACLLAASSITGRAGDSNPPSSHLNIDDDDKWTKPDVVHPGYKYFVPEASVFHIECTAPDAAKKGHTLSWFKVNTADWSKEEVASRTDESSSPLIFTRVNASHAGRYDCVAQGHAFANLSIELFVSSGAEPAALHLPANESDTQTLECKAAGAKWTLNGAPIKDDQIVEGEKNLTIKSPVGPRTGVYMCSGSGHGVSQVQMFKVQGAPYAPKEHSQSKKNLMEGERAEIKCELVGYPLFGVKWQRKNEATGEETEINSKTERVQFHEYKGVKNAMIVVPELQFADSGDYTCIAENEIGQSTYHVSLRVKDKLAALWPFLGIVVEVVILVSIIFIYEKRRSSKDEQVADDEEEEEEQKKALTSGETVDVRQRGVKS